MKPRTQVIVLAALLALLGGVALFTVGPFKPKGRRVAAPAVSTAGAALTAVAKAAGTVPAETLPAGADLEQLTGWLAAAPRAAAPAAQAGRVLGLAAIPVGQAAEKGALTTARGEVLVAPKLDGILWRAEQGKALIGGEAYLVGERVPGAGLTVAAIEANAVRFRADDGRTLTVELAGDAAPHAVAPAPKPAVKEPEVATQTSERPPVPANVALDPSQWQ